MMVKHFEEANLMAEERITPEREESTPSEREEYTTPELVEYPPLTDVIGELSGMNVTMS